MDGIAGMVAELETFMSGLNPELRSRMAPILAELMHQRQQVVAGLQGLQGSLDDLRLHVRYMVFDLEATRREHDTTTAILETLRDENRRLRAMLELPPPEE